VDNSNPDLICKVSIPNTYAKAYDYALHEDKPLIGSRVLVPFRKQERVGVVLDYAPPEKTLNLKPILKILDEKPVFDEKELNWLKWISQYYHTPFSEILALALPKALKDANFSIRPAQEIFVELQKNHFNVCPKPSKKNSALIALLETQAMRILDLKTLGFSKSFIDKALETGLVRSFKKDKELVFESKSLLEIQLNAEQKNALEMIDFSRFAVYLLKGVTGSGKTEVYIEAIKNILQKGKQVLYLVPEISLTPGLLQRLESRLSIPLTVFHSQLSEKQRSNHWISTFYGQASLIVGTRSAIFAPIANLGLVIIDEEHDLSFKQIDGVRYSAKDAVIMRAKMQDIPVILGTATPTLETFQHAKKAHYQLLTLSQKALNQTPLHYQVVDMRRQKIQHGLAEETLNIIKQHLEKKQQVLIFINRRGYAPLLFCHDCGGSIECRRCDANLTVHRSKYQLVCHHCGWSQKTPSQCPKCFSHQLMPLGVGTEQVADFLSSYFPQEVVLRFDRDVIKNKAQLEEGLQKIQQQESHLIVATQMLAKGHHFPHLSLVVVLDGDSSFYQADFRALERLGQMLTQVSGRAGRADIPGEVCIQTHLPQHPLLLMLIQKGYEPFLEELLKQRQEAQLPPFTYLALIRIQGRDSKAVMDSMQNLAQALKNLGVEVWGPSPAPIERKANIHRWQIILKAPLRTLLHNQLAQTHAWLSQNCPKGLRWFIEVDPHDWSS
jgi:primosomal protein N' (replication factor Y)